MKTGRLSKAEWHYIEENADTMSPEEIAANLDREVEPVEALILLALAQSGDTGGAGLKRVAARGAYAGGASDLIVGSESRHDGDYSPAWSLAEVMVPEGNRR